MRVGFIVFSVYSVSADDLMSYISYEDICQRGDRNKFVKISSYSWVLS